MIRSACLVALLGLVLLPMPVSAQTPTLCSAPTAIGCRVVPVPEPSALLLLAPGVAAVALWRARMKNKK
jgi:hypothetical protein